MANGVDAITKFKKLVDMGEAKTEENEEYRIDVRTDEAAKTLTIEDNGIGMSEEEVENTSRRSLFRARRTSCKIRKGFRRRNYRAFRAWFLFRVHGGKRRRDLHEEL